MALTNARANAAPIIEQNILMTEKLPVPCQHCHATGLKAGAECRECAGKGYRLLVDGKVTALRPAPKQGPSNWPASRQWRRSR